MKSTSCRRVLSSSFIAVAVGSGIILDNFTVSREDREERGPQVELAPTGDCGSFPFAKPYETVFGLVIPRIFNETYDFTRPSDISRDIARDIKGAGVFFL